MKNSLFAEALLSGKWSEDIAWDFYLTDVAPSTELCTSVMFEAKAYKLEDLGDIREEFKQIAEFGLQAFQEKHAG